MARLLIILVLLIAGLIAGPFLIGEKGYVLIAMGHWTVEMSVVSLTITVIAALLIWWTLEWLIRRIWRGLDGSANWFGNWHRQRKHKAFSNGLLALDEQNYSEANRLLAKVEANRLAPFDQMLLAQAMKKLGHGDTARQIWLEAVEEKTTELAAQLHLIRDSLQNNHADEALKRIQTLTGRYPQHPGLLQLWAQALAMKGDWLTLQQRLKRWKKILSASNYHHWMQQAAYGRLAEIASKQGANQLKEEWHQSPRAMRKDPAQQAAYVQLLLGQDMHQDAMQVLLEAQSMPDPHLLPLFKRIRSQHAEPAIKRLQGWLKADENDVQLLSTLAHLAFNSGDVALAERVLTKRLNLSHDREDMLLMAKVKETQQQPQQALQWYKKCLPTGLVEEHGTYLIDKSN